jgi:hypothetical protein
LESLAELELCVWVPPRRTGDADAPKAETVVEGEGPIRKETYDTGDWYFGQFNGDVREGRGRYVYAEGNVLEFEGDFKNGLGDGLGVFKYGCFLLSLSSPLSFFLPRSNSLFDHHQKSQQVDI